MKGAHLITGIADLDHDRFERRGYPEAVYGEGKSVSQLRKIAAAIRDRGASAGPTLFTRLDDDRIAAVVEELPDARVESQASLVVWPPVPPTPTGGQVAVMCAGTSDLKVASEAFLTVQYLGREARLIVDVGVAGLHRLEPYLETLRRMDVVVVVAGMDGALPSVVAGLLPAPVIAVPTSVGYGAAFGGLAPLLTMLNSCAPGVAVVNIDNGYGAGHLAAQIAAPRRTSPSAGDNR